ncbi:hypothetical protein [Hymenobacter tenuis]
MLLATASFNPAFYAVPAKLPTPAALEFWLENPLLIAAHPALVAERKEQWPGWSAGERLKLLFRLKSRRDKLKATLQAKQDDLSLQDLLAYIDAHDSLVDDRLEKTNIRAFAFMLHSQERAWYQAFLREVFRLRYEALSEKDAA